MNSRYCDHRFKIPRLNVCAWVNITLAVRKWKRKRSGIRITSFGMLFIKTRDAEIAWINTLYTSGNCDLGDTHTSIFSYRRKVKYIIVVKLKQHTKRAPMVQTVLKLSVLRVCIIMCVLHYITCIQSFQQIIVWQHNVLCAQQCFWQGDIRLVRIM